MTSLAKVDLSQRTRENWTWGIINIPLLYGHDNRNGVNPKTIIRKVEHNARCYRKPFPALDKSKRYLWFELDVIYYHQHQELLQYFRALGMGVYWHRSFNGFHYITVEAVTREEYELIMSELKEKYDNMTFSYSLRVVPNKWMGERKIWHDGDIERNGCSENDYQLLEFIEKAFRHDYQFNFNKTIPETVKLLDNVFCISRYQFKKHLRV